jgi:hypothetical protein
LLPLADDELLDDRHLERRLIRTPPGAGCVTVKDGRVLLLRRPHPQWSSGVANAATTSLAGSNYFGSVR